MSEPAIRRFTPEMVRSEIDRIKRERRETITLSAGARAQLERFQKIEQLQYEAETHLCAAQACFDAIGLLK